MTPSDIAKLWDFLSQTWGNKFLEEYGTTPNEAWKMALANVSLDAARFAVTGLIQEGQPFAPTLPEFIGYCRRYRPPVPVLPEPAERKVMSRDEIRHGLDELRKTLGLPPRRNDLTKI